MGWRSSVGCGLAKQGCGVVLLMRIRIQLFTFMRIQILIKLMRICNADNQTLHGIRVSLYGSVVTVSLQGSIVSLLGSNVNLHSFHADPDSAFTLMRIRTRIGSDFSESFVSYSGSCYGSYMIFSNICLNINFTFVFQSCLCVRLHITTRYKLFRGFFSEKRNLYFCK